MENSLIATYTINGVNPLDDKSVLKVYYTPKAIKKYCIERVGHSNIFIDNYSQINRTVKRINYSYKKYITENEIYNNINTR